MFKFFSEAKQELEHVVWPTTVETKKYMYYTVGVIVIMAILLQLLGVGLRGGLSIIRDQFPHDAISTTVSGEAATGDDINNIINSLSGKVSKSGSVRAETAPGSGTVQVINTNTTGGVMEVTPVR